jgi:regulator of RNase E activity RraA
MLFCIQHYDIMTNIKQKGGEKKMSAGNRIFQKRNLPSKDLVKEFAKIPTANIADSMNRSCALNPRIQLRSTPANRITAGPALTVKTRAGDNLMIHAALDMAEEGDIIVVSNESDTTRALMGEIMFTYAHWKKIGGLILDGPIRDRGTASAMDYPIYATGYTPNGPYKMGPGEVNVPISCGEISVSPGDILVVDSDGVIVVPLSDAEAILKKAKALQASDSAKVLAATNGTAERAWVKKALMATEVEVIDAVY